jgi:hypothetical protein
MLSYFRMNVSHNLLSKLSSNSNFSTKDYYIQSNIRVILITISMLKLGANLHFLHRS